jgi:peptidoglycan/LPS O-acetylase OafA/YrhL
LIVADRRLLRRARWWTVVGGLVAGGAAALVVGPDHGAAVTVGAIWAALNLRTLEGLVSAAVLPRDRPRDRRAVFLWAILKMGVYVLAVWLLVMAPFPVAGMAVGLTIMLASLVLAGLTTRSEAGQEPPRRGDDDRA